MMVARIYKRILDEDGAITVDWVVLTAGIVSLGMIVGGVIWDNTGNAAQDLATFVGSQPIKTTFN